MPEVPKSPGKIPGESHRSAAAAIEASEVTSPTEVSDNFIRRSYDAIGEFTKRHPKRARASSVGLFGGLSVYYAANDEISLAIASGFVAALTAGSVIISHKAGK